MGIDKSLTFLREGHDITLDDVLKAFNNEKARRKPISSDNEVNYDYANGNYAINVNLGEWDECTDEEKAIFTPEFSNTFQGRKDKVVPINAHNPAETKKLKKLEDKFDEDKIRTWFPETWIWDIHYMGKSKRDTKKEFEVTVPDTMTTWLFTAFSVNRKFGFGLAEPQELEVLLPFFVEFSVPSTLRLGEILKLDLTVFNYVPENLDNDNGKLKVYATHDDEIHFKFAQVSGAGAGCSTTYLDDKEQEIDGLNFKHNDGTQLPEDEKIFIEALQTGTMIIKVAATMKIGKKTYQDVVIKEIEVINEGVPEISPVTFEFRHEEYKKDTQNYIHRVDETPSATEISAVISGQIAGPAINFEDGKL